MASPERRTGSTGFQNRSYLRCKPESGHVVPPSCVCKPRQCWQQAPAQPWEAAEPPLHRCWHVPPSRDEPQTFLSTADSPAAVLGNLLCLMVTALNVSGVLAVHHRSRIYAGKKEERKNPAELEGAWSPRPEPETNSPPGGWDHTCWGFRQTGFLSAQGWGMAGELQEWAKHGRAW